MSPTDPLTSQARPGNPVGVGPDETQAPLLTVTKGQPTAEELAAVTAVVLALQTGQDNESTATPARPWARRAQLHLPPKPGAGSWRRSSR